MLEINRRQSFGKIISNVATTRIAGSWGQIFTPGENTKGSWVEVLASAAVTDDSFGAWVILTGISVSGGVTDSIVDIGVDSAGGTDYEVLIPDLLASCAPSSVQTGLLAYWFPLFIPAGSSVAVRGSINSATVGTGRVALKLAAQPSRPDAIDVGTFCRAFGVTAASSSGTAITPGTTSDGDWTSLGTTAHDLWHWQLGLGINNTTITALGFAGDLACGDASNKHLIVQDQTWHTNTLETIVSHGGGGAFDVAAGTELFARMQCSGTPISGISMAAYGVG